MQLYPPCEFMTNLQVLVSHQQIEEKIKQVAEQIDREYAGKELTIVMVMKGAICLAADLIRKIRIPCEIEYVQASSYGQRGTERGKLVLFGLDHMDIQNKDLLVVDDIFDSGLTLFQIVSQLQTKGPKSLKSLVLLHKNVPHQVSYRPDYVLFDIDNHFVVGYGLDYKERYRGLDGVYILKE